MAKLSIEDLTLKGKNILVRVDFNVPLDDNQNVKDDFRIRAALPTIQKIIKEGGRAVLCSHLGRPKGKRVEAMSLKPVAGRLSDLLGMEVKFADDCIGPDVQEMKKSLKDGEVMLLENLRFHAEEEKNDPDFAKKLAEGCQLYINDAFGSAHRAHASTEGATRFFEKCAAGYLMQKELDYLGEAVENPARPFVTILGGAKISGKIDVINNLMTKADALLIGGGMIFTFFKAQGKEIGQSLLEEDRLEMAEELLKKFESSSCQVVLPTDVMVADKVESGAKTRMVDVTDIPSDWKGVDIGPETVKKFKQVLEDAKTIIWNGPMGIFEISEFAGGTEQIARYLAEITDRGATTIVGGGDSASAVKKFKLMDRLSHVSTGGGASLEFLEGKTLPGVAALSDK
ncbi:MAG: phosphoglycerate kinase [Calditrichaeota bacterium]|nr:phosphoglycerate kinase [Calditrichota bacterium]RQV98161.1 MAG: phosphoglycerate kinase [Calditrichota bacterium]